MRKATMPRLGVTSVAVFATVIAACATAQQGQVRQSAPDVKPQVTPEVPQQNQRG